MLFETKLESGKLIRRYKRFLADIQLDDGRKITAHVPNSGAMTGCADAGLLVAVRYNPSPKRKLDWTWEMVDAGSGWIGINTMRSNSIVKEALEKKKIAGLDMYQEIESEVPYGHRSRVDFLLRGQGKLCYVEVKNCTLRRGNIALFPDAVTKRGAKHLRELAGVVEQGHRGVILFLVNRGDCSSMSVADDIDPEYGRLLREVSKKGVEILAYGTKLDFSGIEVEGRLPVRL